MSAHWQDRYPNDLEPMERDDLSAARGIVTGLLLSTPIWALIALAWWLA